MKKTTPLAATIAVTLIGAVLCQAQDASASAIQKRFAILDADKNGSVSLEEFVAKAKQKNKAPKTFAKMDANNDGSLSLEEFSASKNKTPQQEQPASEATDSAEETDSKEATDSAE